MLGQRENDRWIMYYMMYCIYDFVTKDEDKKINYSMNLFRYQHAQLSKHFYSLESSARRPV